MRIDITKAAGGPRVRQCEAGERGLGPKTRNQAIVARFRACLVKRRYGGVAGGGGDLQPHDLDRWGGE